MPFEAHLEESSRDDPTLPPQSQPPLPPQPHASLMGLPRLGQRAVDDLLHDTARAIRWSRGSAPSELMETRNGKLRRLCRFSITRIIFHYIKKRTSTCKNPFEKRMIYLLANIFKWDALTTEWQAFKIHR
ncbi:uncharacterized protein LOC133916950 [Phragmites australis]|uniref:uncharacterized protein LOC133916950 n=1 Tax=Phragmites australis TaxID=29695 RepID=UPI002D78EC88|nr:uncharacterized protein LOC133916950 [Phragmites australis]